MTTPQNYASQAYQSLVNGAKTLFRKGMRKDARFLEALARKIHESVHFSLPNYGRIFDDQYRGLVDSAMHLPFSSVTMEYAVPEPSELVLQGALAHSPKRVIVACEVKPDDGSLDWLPKSVADQVRKVLRSQPSAWFLEAMDLENVNTEDLDRGILVLGVSSVPIRGKTGIESYAFMPEMSGWVLPAHYPTAQTLNTLRPEAVAQTAKVLPIDPKKMQGGIIVGAHIIAMEEVVQTATATMSPAKIEEFLLNISRDIGQEAGAVLEFMEAAGCSNVTSSIVQSALKPAVAQRRLRDGKAPIFETRVLSLELPSKRADGARGDAPGGRFSNRASPEQHVRRGHPRRLANGKRIWIQDMVVGDDANGTRLKSYHVKPVI